MDEHASKSEALLFAARQERAPLACFVKARIEMFKPAPHEYVPHFLVRNILLGIGVEQSGAQCAKRKILALRHEGDVGAFRSKDLAAAPRPKSGHRTNERTFSGS